MKPSNRFLSRYLILFSVLLLSFGCGSSGGSTTDSTDSTDDGSTSDDGTTVSLCDNSSVTTANYLMAFHACNAGVEDCTTPNAHQVYLARSDDGETWERIEEFDSIQGSVPAIVYFDNKLYLFSPGSRLTADGERLDWYALNSCFEIIDSGLLDRTVDFEEGHGFTDPSPLVVGDSLYIARRDASSTEANPCSVECYISLDVTTAADFPVFTPVGNLMSITMPVGALTDPSLSLNQSGTYILFASSGENVYAYQSSSLDPLSFTMPADYDSDSTTGDLDDKISSGNGGVPSGFVDLDSNVWLYVNKTVTGGETDQLQILRAPVVDPTATLQPGDFEVVVDETIVPEFTNGSVESPHIINWPNSDWTREQTVESDAE